MGSPDTEGPTSSADGKTSVSRTGPSNKHDSRTFNFSRSSAHPPHSAAPKDFSEPKSVQSSLKHLSISIHGGSCASDQYPAARVPSIAEWTETEIQALKRQQEFLEDQKRLQQDIQRQLELLQNVYDRYLEGGQVLIDPAASPRGVQISIASDGSSAAELSLNMPMYPLLDALPSPPPSRMPEASPKSTPTAALAPQDTTSSPSHIPNAQISEEKGLVSDNTTLQMKPFTKEDALQVGRRLAVASVQAINAHLQRTMPPKARKARALMAGKQRSSQQPKGWLESLVLPKPKTAGDQKPSTLASSSNSTVSVPQADDSKAIAESSTQPSQPPALSPKTALSQKLEFHTIDENEGPEEVNVDIGSSAFRSPFLSPSHFRDEAEYDAYVKSKPAKDEAAFARSGVLSSPRSRARGKADDGGLNESLGTERTPRSHFADALNVMEQIETTPRRLSVRVDSNSGQKPPEGRVISARHSIFEKSESAMLTLSSIAISPAESKISYLTELQQRLQLPEIDVLALWRDIWGDSDKEWLWEEKELVTSFCERLVTAQQPLKAHEMIKKCFQVRGHKSDPNLRWLRAFSMVQAKNTSLAFKYMDDLLVDTAAIKHVRRRLKALATKLLRIVTKLEETDQSTELDDQVGDDPRRVYALGSFLLEQIFLAANAATMFNQKDPNRPSSRVLPNILRWDSSESAQASRTYLEAMTPQTQKDLRIAFRIFGDNSVRLGDLLALFPVSEQESLVLVFCGIRVNSPREQTNGFPNDEKLDAGVQQAISSAIEGMAPVACFTMLSSGSEIIFAEQAIKLNLELHVVVPYNITEYIEAYVRYGSETMNNWVERFRYVLQNAEVHSICEEQYVDSPVVAQYATTLLQGLAKVRATELREDGKPTLLYMNDSSPLLQGGGDSKRVQTFLDSWNNSGCPSTCVDLRAIRHQYGILDPSISNKKGRQAGAKQLLSPASHTKNNNSSKGRAQARTSTKEGATKKRGRQQGIKSTEKIIDWKYDQLLNELGSGSHKNKAAAFGQKVDREIHYIAYVDLDGNWLTEKCLPVFHKTMYQLVALTIKICNIKPMEWNTWKSGFCWVFRSAIACARFSLTFFEQFRETDWRALELIRAPAARIGLDGGPCWSHFNPLLGRTTIFGLALERAASIASVAAPGHIWGSAQFIAALCMAEVSKAGHVINTMDLVDLKKKFHDSPKNYHWDYYGYRHLGNNKNRCQVFRLQGMSTDLHQEADARGQYLEETLPEADERMLRRRDAEVAILALQTMQNDEEEVMESQRLSMIASVQDSHLPRASVRHSTSDNSFAMPEPREVNRTSYERVLGMDFTHRRLGAGRDEPAIDEELSMLSELPTNPSMRTEVYEYPTQLVTRPQENEAPIPSLILGAPNHFLDGERAELLMDTEPTMQGDKAANPNQCIGLLSTFCRFAENLMLFSLIPGATKMLWDWTRVGSVRNLTSKLFSFDHPIQVLLGLDYAQSDVFDYRLDYQLRLDRLRASLATLNYSRATHLIEDLVEDLQVNRDPMFKFMAFLKSRKTNEPASVIEKVEWQVKRDEMRAALNTNISAFERDMGFGFVRSDALADSQADSRGAKALKAKVFALAGKMHKEICIRKSGLGENSQLVKFNLDLRQAEISSLFFKKSFSLDPRSYTAFNAALMMLLLGDKTAESFAKDVIRCSSTELGALEMSKQNNVTQIYWRYMMVAQAYVILEQPNKAVVWFRKGLKLSRDEMAGDSHARSLLVLKSMRLLGLVTEIPSIMDQFKDEIGRVAVFYSHHMYLDSQMLIEGENEYSMHLFLEQVLVRTISKSLDKAGIAVGYCLLLGTPDLLFAEALLAKGVELHVFLPFDKEDFCAHAKKSGLSLCRRWVARCNAVFQSAIVHYVATEKAVDVASLLDFARQVMTGAAELEADRIQARPLVTICLLQDETKLQKAYKHHTTLRDHLELSSAGAEFAHREVARQKISYLVKKLRHKVRAKWSMSNMSRFASVVVGAAVSTKFMSAIQAIETAEGNLAGAGLLFDEKVDHFVRISSRYETHVYWLDEVREKARKQFLEVAPSLQRSILETLAEGGDKGDYSAGDSGKVARFRQRSSSIAFRRSSATLSTFDVRRSSISNRRFSTTISRHPSVVASDRSAAGADTVRRSSVAVNRRTSMAAANRRTSVATLREPSTNDRRLSAAPHRKSLAPRRSSSVVPQQRAANAPSTSSRVALKPPSVSNAQISVTNGQQAGNSPSRPSIIRQGTSLVPRQSDRRSIITTSQPSGALGAPSVPSDSSIIAPVRSRHASVVAAARTNSSSLVAGRISDFTAGSGNPSPPNRASIISTASPRNDAGRKSSVVASTHRPSVIAGNRPSLAERGSGLQQRNMSISVQVREKRGTILSTATDVSDDTGDEPVVDVEAVEFFFRTMDNLMRTRPNRRYAGLETDTTTANTKHRTQTTILGHSWTNPHRSPRDVSRVVKTIVFADIRHPRQMFNTAEDPLTSITMLHVAKEVLSNFTTEFVNSVGRGVLVVFNDQSSAARFSLEFVRKVEEFDWAALGLPPRTTARVMMHTGPVYWGFDELLGMHATFLRSLSFASLFMFALLLHFILLLSPSCNPPVP